MWHIYISIAVLFRGAFCNPVTTTAKDSNCKVVIKRFGEQVDTLEVKWHSTIYLICDASCVGPGPQPALRWFYRDKNKSKDIDIEKLFQSPKFETYPTNFHRKNELVIRDFGKNEETDFICRGSVKQRRHEAKVALNGTDCLLKYNFRCTSGKKCIDRAYLCNQNNECPDGEDEVGCGNNMNTTAKVATITMQDEGVVIGKTSKEIVTAAPPAVCTADQYKCANGECVDGRYRCDGQHDCYDVSDEENCPFRCAVGEFKCAGEDYCVTESLRCDGTSDCSDRSDEFNCTFRCAVGEFKCAGEDYCVAESLRCDETSDCSDRSDELNCTFRCAVDEFKCAGVDNCVAESLRCDGTSDCSDRSDELNCTPVCSASEFQCKSGTCIDLARKCDGFPDCPDESDEVADCFNKTKLCSEGQMVCKDRLGSINCVSPQEWNPSICISECRQDEFQCQNGQCISAGQRCDRQSQCTDGSDEINCTCPINTFQCRQTNILECIENNLHCDGSPDCTDGSDEKGCSCAKDFFRCNDGNCVPDRLRCDGIQQCEDGSDEIQCEREKTIMVSTGINGDGDNGLFSTTDGVTDNTGEFTDTTPFDYDVYAN